MKKSYSYGLLQFLWLFLLPVCGFANHVISSTIHIHTHFQKIIDKPSWLIIVQDQDSPGTYPYLFDLVSNDHDFLIDTHTQHYRLTSIMQFASTNQKITHFCELPPTIFANESVDIFVTGTLTAEPTTSQCHFRRIKNQ